MIQADSFLLISAYLGAALSTGLASISAGIGEGYAAGEAAKSLMKQPKSGDSLLKTMLISQAVTETGAIFGLVISLLLIFGGAGHIAGSWFKVGALLAAGLAMGLGSIGPGFGAGYTGGQACSVISRLPKESNRVTTNMLIGQALAQTDAIFALVVALLLLYSIPNPTASTTVATFLMKGSAFIGASLAIGLGTLGPGMGIGFVTGRAANMLGRFPRERGAITRTMFLGAAVSESTAIYALVIAFLLIFFS